MRLPCARAQCRLGCERGARSSREPGGAAAVPGGAAASTGASSRSGQHSRSGNRGRAPECIAAVEQQQQQQRRHPPPPVPPPPQRRRGLLLHASLAPLLVQAALLGSDDATTILNSVLSGYGLPTLAASKGYRPYDELEDEFTFEYPRSWVSRPNSMRRGVYIANFQTADKVTVEELDPPEDGDLASAAVAAAVLAGGTRLVQDDTLSLPAKRLVKASSAAVDGQEYLYLEFPSETVTRSGYNIKRKNYVVAALSRRRNKLYTLTASARSDQFDEEKREVLQHVVQSFRLR